MPQLTLWTRLLPGLVLLPLCGCIVPQPRGEGTLQHLTEPSTHRAYYLYLPKEYVTADAAGRAARAWPLVMTFHGMKPYDMAISQALEWQQEADRYGLIVVAPELLAFDFVFGEFPLQTINRAFKSDELATLAVLDHVLQTTRADPGNVLSTSWSSGGYLAHYMLNRHPDRFTCLAVRQSDFSASVLDSTWTSMSLYHPVLVLGAQNDIPICREETQEAIRWYESHGYKNFAWVVLKRLYHERTPDMAAEFFARVAGVAPNRPPEMLLARQAIDGNSAGLELMAGRMGQVQRAPGEAHASRAPHGPRVRGPTPPRPVVVAAEPPPPTEAPAAPPPPPVAVEPPALSGEPTPKRGSLAERPTRSLSPVGVRVSTALGFEPLPLTYSADCPADWHRTASFHWSLDGRPIGDGVNGEHTLAQPGDYILELRVVTKEGVMHQASRRIRVLKTAPPDDAERRGGS